MPDALVALYAATPGRSKYRTFADPTALVLKIDQAQATANRLNLISQGCG
jgi:hypothetical protein